MGLAENYKHTTAKSFTELAIQNGLITKFEDSAQTAKEVSKFYDTIIKTIGTSTEKE